MNIAQNSGFHHLAISRDQQRNRADVYLDGSLISSVAPTSSPEPLNLGTTQFKVSTREVTEYFGYYNYHIQGSMDDVRLYNRRLQAAEVDAIYNHGNSSSNAAK